MIATDTRSLMREIVASRKKMDQFLVTRREMIRRYAGARYREDAADVPRSPENYPFAYKQFVKPQILFGTPSCSVNPRTRAEHANAAEGLEAAINYWAKETAWKQTMDEVIDDAFFGFGITKTGIAPRGHYSGAGLGAVYGDFEQRPNYPHAVRISPQNFVVDVEASSLRRARLIGHFFERDKDDVLADETYDPAAASRLAESRRERLDQNQTYATPKREDADPQHEPVTLIELYLPEHGLLMTLGELGGEDAVILRHEEYFGPDEGPYDLWGLEIVAGELVPISPLQALWDEFVEVQEHSRAAAESAACHKKFGVYAPGAREDANRIQQVANGGLVMVADPQAVNDMELGGVSDQQINYIQFLRERFERNLGFGDAQRGIAGSKTATAEQLAQSNSDLRIDRMKDRVRDSLLSVYRKVGWYFHNDPTIGRIPMLVTDQTTGQQVPAVFVAGPWMGGYVTVPGRGAVFLPPQDESEMVDFDLDIDDRTMSKVNDALEQKRAQDELALAFQLLQMGMPVNLTRVLDRYGEAFNTRQFSKVILLQTPLDPLALYHATQAAPPVGRSQGSVFGVQKGLRSPSGLPGLFNNARAGMT